MCGFPLCTTKSHQVAGNDHFVFCELDVLVDAETFQQLLRFLLRLKLLLSENTQRTVF